MQYMARLMVLIFCVLCGIYPAEAQPAVQRGTLSPSPPLRLEYELPEVLLANGEIVLPLTLTTPLTAGELQFQVVSSVGLMVVEGGTARFNLSGATQPFVHPLKLQLSSEAARYAIVLLSAHSQIGEFSRSYRIDFSAPPTAHPSVKTTLKIMPASPVR